MLQTPTARPHHTLQQALQKGLLAFISGALALAAAVVFCRSFGSDSAATFVLLSVLALTFWQITLTRQAPVPELVLLDFAVIAALTFARQDAAQLWHVPQAWGDVLHLTPLGSGLALALYIITAVRFLALQRRHVGLTESWAILVLPLVFNLALALGSTGLMEDLGNRLSLGFAPTPALQAAVGRAGLMTGAGALLAGTFYRVLRGRQLRDWRFYGLLALSSGLAALTPLAAMLPERAARLPNLLDMGVAVAGAALAQAGLWALVYLLTGIAMDAIRGKPPCLAAGAKHWLSGLKKGLVYGGLFMALLLAVAFGLRQPLMMQALAETPLVAGALIGALAFPLLQTIVSSADETPPFFGRLWAAYRVPRAYARGLVLGTGIAAALAANLGQASGGERFALLFGLGALAYAGVDLVFDGAAVLRGPRKRLQTWRVYALAVPLGGIVAGALGWYFDANQIAVVTTKFWAYVDLDYAKGGRGSPAYVIYALFSKWAMMDLGPVTGGVKLFYLESVSGVINWSIAAPLFGINYFLLQALVKGSLKPVRGLLSRQGLSGLMEQTIRVLRWGLWMAPVIYSFLRMSPEPSWYNQDGLARTVAASIASVMMPGAAFNGWSLSLFTGLLAYDWLRVLIWLDHMGLRVATLVNLSFVGGDRGDEAAARFVGHSARTRFVPEGIRRFATWAPLLIPFYIPRGADWDTAWSAAERITKQHEAMSAPVTSLVFAYGILGVLLTLVGLVIRWRLRDVRPAMAAAVIPADVPVSVWDRPLRYRLSNGLIGVDLTPDGCGYTRLHGVARGAGAIDLTRRPMDSLQPRGPFFYVQDAETQAQWSLTYQPMLRAGADYDVTHPTRDTVRFAQTLEGAHSDVRVTLSDTHSAVVRTVELTNTTAHPRRLVLTSFEELACHETGAYLRDPDFNAMHVETVFAPAVQALFARNRLLRDKGVDEKAKRMSPEVMVFAIAPEAGVTLTGYEDSRTRFIGTGTVQSPQGLAGNRARALDDAGLLATFDPAASFQLAIDLPAHGTCRLRFLTAHAMDAKDAARMAADFAKVADFKGAVLKDLFATRRLLEPAPAIPADTAPYVFDDAARTLQITGATPRPWAHVMANPAGFGTMVANDGEIYSFNGNARHNGLTPWVSDPARVCVPGQRICLRDVITGARFVVGKASTPQETLRVTYGLGTATFVTSTDTLDIEMQVATLHDAPADVRLVTLRNRADTSRRFAVTSLIDMALDESTNDSRGHMRVEKSPSDVLVFTNPANNFRQGAAFVITSLAKVKTETVRARVLGAPGRNVADALLLTDGITDPSQKDDGRRIAAHQGEIDVPPNGEVCFSVVLGQTQKVPEAMALSERLRDPAAVRARLAATQAWWQTKVTGVEVKTNNPDFDRLVNHWLPYQLLASRLWGRVGPNQRGGAIGFRDQLQDILPLIYHDPSIVRAQIVLHAGQQFIEGDVLKWWHQAADGSTLMGQRTRASDPHLWLPYVLVRYIAATADASVAYDVVPYLEGPALAPDRAVDLVMPRPSRDTDDVYGHCKRAIEYALARLGPHGLPLVGAGDWNDGIDVAGLDGAGESVWMGFFLHDVLRDFTTLALARNPADARRYRAAAADLAKALDVGFQGGRYLIGFEDYGQPFQEASIMTAAWPILSGAVSFDRGLAALEAGLADLERADRILLVSPPFDETSEPYPGRIADYPAGVRENGAQYTHGASWVVDAYVRLSEMARRHGDAELGARLATRAFETWRKLSPLGKTEGAALAAYGLAPHQQPADIYDGAWHAGRGGWSWYTGSAARMLSSAYSMLGVKMVGGEVWMPTGAVEPCPALKIESLRVGAHHVRPTWDVTTGGPVLAEV